MSRVVVKKSPKKQVRKGKFLIQNERQDPFEINVTGRVMWALENLMDGPCTPINRPAPRWSDYIFRLRGEGVQIHTEHEEHRGEFPGTHGKYHLLSKVTPIKEAA
ncbi:hypothetical protein [Amylibacter sp. SFDW26]|uniref:winged helix domain-containing protein n=1 Tax=Amylibacter sp. SFDW26 TaxID=2652722 RepID=UPI001D02CA60|nr:hypothetical protein [Amylibacter sp. SFDW26]